MKAALYDSSYWYVVNNKYHHIVYRSHDINKAEKYAVRKNSSLTSGAEVGEYGVVSGQQLMAEQITSIGYLSHKIA